ICRNNGIGIQMTGYLGPTFFSDQVIINNQIHNNTYFTNVDSQPYGITMGGYCRSDIIRGNNITGHIGQTTTGVFIGMGIRVWEPAAYNIIENNNVSNNVVGIHGGYPEFQHHMILNNSVWNNKNYGIHTEHGDAFNVIDNNTVGKSGSVGIVLEYINTGPPLYDQVSKNTLIDNLYGIKISNSRDDIPTPIPISNYISIENNMITGSYCGVILGYAKNNTIFSNQISGCNRGIWCLYSSEDNTFKDNVVTGNSYGFYLQSANNTIYHNNIINNTVQAYDESYNLWDNGYPSGGNYWSDYTGTDMMSGPNQNLPGSDGIGDLPYNSTTGQGIQGGSNVDRYPLMSSPAFAEFSIPVHPGWNLISLPVIPDDCSLPNALLDKGGDTNWSRVLWYDTSAPTWARWKQYYTAWDPSLNDLTKMDHTMGVWLYVTDAGDGFLTIKGRLPMKTSIQLYAGWNMVGYPAIDDSTYTVWDLKNDTGASTVEGFDATSPYLTKVLGNTYLLKRGEGYWVHVSAGTTWTVDW
ncbi:MAG: NosD domain-containing protein, partial [Candidatus Thermoplasmatota archaeon]